jgi:hypothetical protein
MSSQTGNDSANCGTFGLSAFYDVDAGQQGNLVQWRDAGMAIGSRGRLNYGFLFNARREFLG